MSPGNAEYLHKRGDAYLFSGDIKTAVSNYRESSGLLRTSMFLSRKVAAVFDVQGQLLLDKGAISGALSSFTEAVNLDPGSSIYLMHRAIARAGLGDLARAVQDLDQALVLDPHNADAYVLRARVYNRTGSFDLAILNVNHALKLLPNHQAALEYRNEQAHRAKDCTAKATELLFLGNNEEVLGFFFLFFFFLT